MVRHTHPERSKRQEQGGAGRPETDAGAGASNTRVNGNEQRNRPEPVSPLLRSAFLAASGHDAGADTDDDLVDVDLLLPKPLRPAAIPAGQRLRLGSLLQEGLEGGSIRRDELRQILSGDEYEEPVPELERLAVFVAEELGIPVTDGYGSDLRRQTSHASEDDVDGALALLGGLVSDEHEPLQMYLADLRSPASAPLPRGEEQQLGLTMEEAMGTALRAIARCAETRLELCRLLGEMSVNPALEARVAEMTPARSEHDEGRQGVEDDDVEDDDDDAADADDAYAHDAAADDSAVHDSAAHAAADPAANPSGARGPYSPRTDTLGYLLAQIDAAPLVREALTRQRVSLTLLTHLRERADAAARAAIDESLSVIAEAHSRLAIANLRVVARRAYKYAYKHRPGKLELPDLIQEGNLGLLQAVATFDYRKGVKFSRHARGWIRQAMLRAIAEHGRTIRITANFKESVKKIARAQRELDADLRSTSDLAAMARHAQMPLSRVEDWAQVIQEPLSADVLRELELEEDEGTLLFEDPQALQFVWNAENASARRYLERLLATLKPRWQQVFRLRFGFHDGRERNLAEVGRLLQVTRERTRQIEFRGLEMLRRAARRTLLNVQRSDRARRVLG